MAASHGDREMQRHTGTNGHRGRTCATTASTGHCRSRLTVRMLPMTSLAYEDDLLAASWLSRDNRRNEDPGCVREWVEWVEWVE